MINTFALAATSIARAGALAARPLTPGTVRPFHQRRGKLVGVDEVPPTRILPEGQSVRPTKPYGCEHCLGDGECCYEL